MDLIKEAGAGPRILTARHISAEKAPPELNTATFNTTLLCDNFSTEPDFHTYLAGLGSYAHVIFPLSGVCVVLLVLLYLMTLRNVRAQSKQGWGNVAVVLSVYPLVGFCAFLVVLLPRVRILSEAIAQEVVMVAMYFFYCYIIAECGGKDLMVRKAGGATLATRVLPCCCWPCCVIPQPQLQKKHLTWIGYLVLQMSIIQAIIYLVILILWAEDTQLYVSAFSYLQPLVAASIVGGVWGAVMCVRAGAGAGAGALRGRLLLLQLALFAVKLQLGAAKVLPRVARLPCVLDLHPVVTVNLFQSCIMQIEMLLLSVLAHRVYRGERDKRPAHVGGKDRDNCI